MVTIAELRAKHNKMSQRELAKELGVTQTSISNWEKDQTKISCVSFLLYDFKSYSRKDTHERNNIYPILHNI